MAMFALLLRNWFLSGIVIAIVFAKIAPGIGSKGGILKPEVTVKYIAVAVIFFNSGISLRSEELKKAVLQVKTHLFIQLFTFLAFPLITQFLGSLLKTGAFNHQIIEGLNVLGCMPPPVSSAVILTKAVGGNEAAAIFNSAFGSFMGIFVTPALILTMVGSEASVPISTIFTQLFMTVVVPLICGQIIRRYVRTWLERNPINFGSLGSAILLLIIYTTFCDTFQHVNIDLDGLDLISIVFLIVILQTILLTVIFFVSSWRPLGYDSQDTIALMFCSTHKSLTLGIPIIKIVFSGDDKLSFISIPLLVYHPTQILLGGILVPWLKSWLHSASRSRFATAQLKMV